MAKNHFQHRPPKIWHKIIIEISPDLADIAASFLTSLTGIGVEQSIDKPGFPLSSSTIIGYLENDERDRESLQKITAYVAHLSPAGTVLFEKIIEEDWSRNWKKDYKSTKISDRITIKPTWETYEPSRDEIVIEIDPGLAFGTGLHESTRLALRLIEKAFAVNTPLSMLDVGTGTGILGMAAALFGADPVTGIDNDPDAVVCARDNVAQNGLSEQMLVQGTALNDINGPFDLVVANITADVLTHLAPRLVNLLGEKGQLVLAGILAGEQADSVEKTFTSLGLYTTDSSSEGEWQALKMFRSS